MSNQKPSDSLLFERGVQEILPSKQGLADLCATRSIKLYLGIDPSGAQLTLGHGVVLRKLQQFLDAGHEVILLIGDATVRIGDPTGREKSRPVLTDEQIEENFQDWKKQAGLILDFSRIQIVRNSTWLDPLRLPDIIRLLASTTVQQLLERDMFQNRLKEQLPIFGHELLYPLLQAYDSVELEVDLEIGGNDQTFNMMFGRTLLKQVKQKEKWVLATPLLVGTDGRKMGKSLNNFIPLADEPDQMFIKLMQVNDEIIPTYLELLTSHPLEKVQKVKTALSDGSISPIELKKQMALLVIQELHGKETAEKAQLNFERTIQEKEQPEDLPEFNVPAQLTLKDLLSRTHSISTNASQSENTRLIQQGAVKLNETVMTDPFEQVSIENEATLRVGKKHWYLLRKEE